MHNSSLCFLDKDYSINKFTPTQLSLRCHDNYLFLKNKLNNNFQNYPKFGLYLSWFPIISIFRLKIDQLSPPLFQWRGLLLYKATKQGTTNRQKWTILLFLQNRALDTPKNYADRIFAKISLFSPNSFA